LKLRKREVKSYGINFKVFTIISLVGLLSITFCRKNDDSNNAKVILYLSDAPAYFKEVNIDIQKVTLKAGGSSNEVNPSVMYSGTYNLIEYSNGIDTILGNFRVPPGKISQAHIVFGTNNTFVNDTENVTLNLSSDVENGLNVDMDESVEAGNTIKLWLDIDVSRSVIPGGSGNYFLNPKVRVFSENNCGSIKGVVIPVNRKPFIYVITESDSIGTITDNSGHFLIRGIREGKYKMRFIPQKPGVQQAVLENVEVVKGKITSVGTININ
jgi:hypothetical protein